MHLLGKAMPRKRLTQESVRKLNPIPGKQVSVFDAGMPGLVLGLNPGGSKTWSALFYVSGKPRYKKLGRYPILSLAQARDAARKFLENPQKAVSETEAGTFKDVSDNFMKRYVEANGLRSKREIARTLSKYILPRWQDRKICDIRRSDVTALLDKVEDDHGARQADMVLAVVRKMMNWHASRHDDYVSPIARNMNRVKAADRARKRVLEDDELRAVWHACDELPTFGALVKFALLTAQRKEKIATLRWDDMADGVWAIRTEPREKGNAGRLRLPEAALDIIADAAPYRRQSVCVHGRPWGRAVQLLFRVEGPTRRQAARSPGALDDPRPAQDGSLIALPRRGPAGHFGTRDGSCHPRCGRRLRSASLRRREGARAAGSC